MTEVDNPFRPGGYLDQEADAILRNSTIQRNSLQIRDPRSSERTPSENPAEEIISEAVEVVVISEKSSRVHFTPRHSDVSTTECHLVMQTVGKQNEQPIMNGSGDHRQSSEFVESKVSNDSCSADNFLNDAVDGGAPVKLVVSSAVQHSLQQPLQAETVNLSNTAEKERRRCCALL